jgi:haloacetate dehalogenase
MLIPSGFARGNPLTYGKAACMVIAGFDSQRVRVADGGSLHAAVGGSSDPIVLLHGFPQTHLMWRHVAPELADDHTVICPDVRGYGASDKPADPAGTAYAKRTMAADVVALARALGHARLRWPGTTGAPRRLPCRPQHAFFGHFLDLWAGHPEAIPADVRAAYLDACRDAVPSIVADYRASAFIDVEHDSADRDAGRILSMPVTVLQQDWSAALGFDAAAIWRRWAPNLHHQTVGYGHFMAEEAPAEIARALRDLLAR